MGCWIETDMLTNLPVDYGEHIAAVLIAQERNPKRTSYPNQTWQPITPLIYGTYDDYGRIEGVGEETERFILDTFRGAEESGIRLIEKDDGGAETVFFEPGTTFADLIDAAADGRLWLRTIYQTKRVALALLKPEYIERCKTFPAAQDVHRTFAEMEAAQETVAANLRAFLNEITDEDERAETAMLWKDQLTRHLMGHTFDPRNPTLNLFYTAGADIETIFCINAALQTLRSAWRPTSGAGSQTGIECQAVVDWYQSIAEDADDAYREYEYQVQCRNEDEADMAAAFDTDDDAD